MATDPPDDLVSASGVAGATLSNEDIAMRWPAAVRSLGHRDFRLLWLGSVLSNIGSWMQIAAQQWVVYEIGGHDKRWLGADAFAAGIPTLLTPLAGVAADRINRKTLIFVSNILLALIAAYLTVMIAVNRLTVWQVLTCSFLSGLAQTFVVPAYVAYMPELVGRREMSNAIALNAAGFNVSRVLGPSLGGVVLALAGAAWCFGLNALSFGAMLIALLMISTHRPQHDTTDRHPWHSLVDGWRYFFSRPDLLTMVSLSLAAGVCIAPMWTMLPAVAHEILHRDEERIFAMLLAIFGAGSLAGAMILAMGSHKAPTPWWAYRFLIGVGVLHALVGFATATWQMGVLLAVCGALIALSLARLNTAITASTPPELRGRMVSFFFMSIAGGIPFGAFTAGYVAEHWQTRGTFVAFGVALILAVLTIGAVARTRGVQYRLQG